jgi:dihydroxyacetone kinase-like protein
MTKAQTLAWLDRQNSIFIEKKEYLTDLDAAIGDADHGINMNRGFAKVMEKLPAVADKDLGVILKTVGMTLMSSVGGASGPLYGTFWMKGAMALDGKEAMDTADFKKFLEAAVAGIVLRGRPEPGDKTMYDLWAPVLAHVLAQDDATPLPQVVATALPVAEAALAATIPLQARKGRASYLGERSIGHPDPGATSSLYMVQTLGEVLQ